ncbi:MAG: UbiH/UbiF/VisC/COQ6 family ubiquinone biosynthesis hydroxylase [Gammaproteobacteria bacterium]|nr:UbiH/UbiF/VisC/COQ6 family ubiquinone biosynthesis hydroxylase [Gammaproteobacteria bacterium]
MSSSQKTDFDVIIVGGGMVGASLARLLRNTDLQILLLDRMSFDDSKIPYRQQERKFDPRVSAITNASKELFKKLEIWQGIEEARCCSYRNMKVWDAEGTGAIEFSADDINQPELGTIIENSLILASLYRCLPDQENLRIGTETIESFQRLDAGQDSTIQIACESGEQYSAKLLVAADGANSKLRELAGFETSEWDYNHQAIVTTVKTELPHNRTALQRFIDTGPLAFLTLEDENIADAHYCSIVWSALPERAESLMALSEEDFNSELARSMEHSLGKISWSDKRFSFPLRQRHATEYIQDNLVLVGDAAHTIHPLAGQGVNLGFLDVGALAEELQRGIKAGRSPGDFTILQRYQRRRIGNNLAMMWLMEGFKHLFAEEALPVRWLRNIGMSGIDKLPLIKNQIARRAMGVD